MASNLGARLASAENSMDIADVMKDIETSTKEFPEKSAAYAKLLCPLFSSPFSSIRRSAFNSALAIVSSEPLAGEQIMVAYRLSILSPDTEVSRHAITYLPHFVSIAKDSADSLVRSAIQSNQKHPFPESMTSIAQAMEITKKVPGIPRKENLGTLML